MSRWHSGKLHPELRQSVDRDLVQAFKVPLQRPGENRSQHGK
jgi:hypothetical protein